MRGLFLRCAQRLLLVGVIAVPLFMRVPSARAQTTNYEFNDSHFHLTNNVQQGVDIHDFLNTMEAKPAGSAIRHPLAATVVVPG